ncbi:MAG: AGE family epimerase/isomerase [Kiritimatiellae bacterium]|nr:AGE family epimerase/isomerase [Kiritimatiellia bacterium]
MKCCDWRCVAGSLVAAALVGGADDIEWLRARAERLDRDLRERILPYWAARGRNIEQIEQEGFVLDDPPRGGPPERMLVTQSRMVWTFSRVHRLGYSDARRDYGAIAAAGYRYLMRRFWDAEHGGAYWAVAADGQPTNPRKMMYGQAFGIYALVEHARAGGGREPLERALAWFRLLRERAYDRRHGGWVEHFERDWRPLPLRDPAGVPEVAGLKSANTHLHLMEAFTELYAETREADVRDALEEVLRINREVFYPRDPARACFHRQPDWSPVDDARSAGLSYGHNVEFGWLMLEAERALGRPLSLEHFRAHLDHALRCGWDAERGGLYHRGEGEQPATDRRKVWWVQAEMLAALTEAWALDRDPRWAAAMRRLWEFADQWMTDPETGVWWDSVEADGRPARAARAHGWKANYHDVRAFLKFIEVMRSASAQSGGACTRTAEA